MGGYERSCAPWALRRRPARRDPAGLQRAPARGGLGPLRGDHRQRAPPRAGDGRHQGHAADQRPRGVHARQRVLPRRDRGRGLLRRRRVLRARPGGRRRRRQGDGRVDRGRRAADGRVGDGRAALRRALPLALATRSSARGRSTRPTTTSSTPATSARPAARCARRAPTRGTSRTAPRSARRAAGSASTTTSPTPPPATRRCARAAGPGCTGRPRSGPSTRPAARRAALFDESSFAKLEIAGPGAAELLERLCDNRVAREVGQITYTQMLNARGGIECDFTVTRVEDELFQVVTGTAFGQHDRAWIARHAPRDGSVRLTRHDRALGLLRALGPAGARRSCAPLTPDPLDFGYLRMRDLAVGDVPVRALRVTFVGELGWELYCPTEYGAGAVAGAVGGGAPARAASPAATRRSTRCAWRRATACGAADITPDDSPHEAGLGFACATTRSFVGARRAARRASAAAAPALPRARGPALGRAGQRAGARRRRRRRAASPRGGYGYTVARSIAYAYLPPEHATSAPRSRSTSSAAGSRARSPPSRCYDPRGERLRA